MIIVTVIHTLDTNSSSDDGEKKKRERSTEGGKKKKETKKTPVTQAIRIHKGSCQKISGLSTHRLQVNGPYRSRSSYNIHISR